MISFINKFDNKTQNVGFLYPEQSFTHYFLKLCSGDSHLSGTTESTNSKTSSHGQCSAACCAC